MAEGCSLVAVSHHHPARGVLAVSLLLVPLAAWLYPRSLSKAQSLDCIGDCFLVRQVLVFIYTRLYTSRLSTTTPFSKDSTPRLLSIETELEKELSKWLPPLSPLRFRRSPTRALSSYSASGMLKSESAFYWMCSLLHAGNESDR